MFDKIIMQASGRYEGIINRLEGQHKETLQLLERVSSPGYIDGIETIKDLFIGVMKGLTYLLTLKRVAVGLKGTVTHPILSK